MQTPVDFAGPHVISDDLMSCAIDDDDRHHLERVLRLRDGDGFTLTDGAGSWRPGRFGAIIEPTGDVHFVERPQPTLTVGFAVVKSAKPSLIVQKLTELGIDRIRPFHADRSVAVWDAAKAPKSHERLVRVAREALMQSKGVWLPTVLPVASFDAVIDDEHNEGNVVARADFDGVDLGAPDVAEGLRDEMGSAGVTVLIGPEGGWSDSERNALGRSVRLGHTVLRAETASIAAGVLLSAARRSNRA